jgi:hypothetical protein
LLRQLRITAIEADIESELFHCVTTLGCASSDANHARALELSNLTDHRTDCTRSGGDNDCFTGLRLTDIE